MNNNEENKKAGTSKVVNIVIGVLFFLVLVSVTTNFYLLKKANESRKATEDNKVIADALKASITPPQKQKNPAAEPAISGKDKNEASAYTEAFNKLLVICLKKDVVPLNTGNCDIKQLEVYTVMAEHNVFLDDFAVIAGGREAFENETRSDAKAKEFYDRWAKYEQSAKGKKSENKIYINRFEAKKGMFLKVFGKELTDEEKNILKVTNHDNPH